MPVYISMLFYITIFDYNEMKAKCHFKGKVFKKIQYYMLNEIGGDSTIYIHYVLNWVVSQR